MKFVSVTDREAVGLAHDVKLVGLSLAQLSNAEAPQGRLVIINDGSLCGMNWALIVLQEVA